MEKFADKENEMRGKDGDGEVIHVEHHKLSHIKNWFEMELHVKRHELLLSLTIGLRWNLMLYNNSRHLDISNHTLKFII